MTGFGEASEQADGVHYAVELRSLNNRYFKSTIRLPDQIAGLEAELETQLRHRLARGSITLVVKTRSSDAAGQRVNDAALTSYLEHLATLHKKLPKTQGNVNIDLTALLALPGVLTGIDEADLLRRARPVVQRLTDQACDKLIAMRLAEGKLLMDDLLRNREFILERVETVRQRAPLVIEEYHVRLRARIDQLIARAELKVDERDLIKEVAIYAERSDVSEEVSRLTGHLEQFEQILRAPDKDAAGRTLDFLAQELLREANTIASKSNDVTTSRAIVEVKGAIDRIKEQVQNVE